MWALPRFTLSIFQPYFSSPSSCLSPFSHGSFRIAEMITFTPKYFAPQIQILLHDSYTVLRIRKLTLICTMLASANFILIFSCLSSLLSLSLVSLTVLNSMEQWTGLPGWLWLLLMTRCNLCVFYRDYGRGAWHCPALLLVTLTLTN